MLPFRFPLLSTTLESNFARVYWELADVWSAFQQCTYLAPITSITDADCTLFISVMTMFLRLYIHVFITSALDWLITYHLSHVPVILQLCKTYLFALCLKSRMARVNFFHSPPLAPEPTQLPACLNNVNVFKPKFIEWNGLCEHNIN